MARALLFHLALRLIAHVDLLDEGIDVHLRDLVT
jgi:hypothetical protein